MNNHSQHQHHSMDPISRSLAPTISYTNSSLAMAASAANNNNISQLQQTTAAVQPQQPKMRKEIYRYTAQETLFAAAWSNKVYDDKRFRLVAGTLLDEENITNNKVSDTF